MHHIAPLDDNTVTRLIGDDVGAGGDGEDPVGERPVGERRIPGRGEIEEIAAVERHAVAVIAGTHAKLGRRDQAAARGECPAFGANETEVDAVGEARVGTPDRFDHFDLAFILGIASDERTSAAVQGIRIERSWRCSHVWNIMGTNVSRKGQGKDANVQRL